MRLDKSVDVHAERRAEGFRAERADEQHGLEHPRRTRRVRPGDGLLRLQRAQHKQRARLVHRHGPGVLLVDTAAVGRGRAESRGRSAAGTRELGDDRSGHKKRQVSEKQRDQR